MGNAFYKNIIYFFSVLGIVLAMFFVIYGSLLPWMKSRAYIRASMALGSVRSVEEMKKVLDPMFELYSPVGFEEMGKFTANALFDAVTNPGQSEPVARLVVEYLEPKMERDNVRHLIMVGRMYLSLWQNHRKPEYLDKAEEYYLLANQIGPKLPQPLYSLFEVYRERGDAARMSQIGERILELWPNETRIRRIEG